MAWWEVVHTLSKWDMCQVSLLSFSQTHGTHNLLYLSFSSSINTSPHLKNKVLTCLAQTLKHYKIGSYHNHSKYLYVTCCHVLTGLLITQSHISLFSLGWLFHKANASANMGVSIFSMQCVALSPACFVNNPNPALKWLIFFYSFLMVLFFPWSLKACWDQTKQTFFDSFRLLMLVYLPDNEKSKRILCLCYTWSSEFSNSVWNQNCWIISRAWTEM